MIIKLKNVDCFAPEALGRCELVIAHDRIATMEKKSDIYGSDVQTVDGKGCIAIPGLVDSLAHITGGGGEGGFATRTPELNVDEAIRAGVTTLIGVLGTDAVTRSLPNLIAKIHAIESSGLSCFGYTGSYQIPPRTLFNDVMEDLMLIDKFIGVGEVAIADHRSSQPTVDELKKLTSQARVGGMLSGKAGIVSVHVGAAAAGLQLLREVVDSSDIPISQFYPTHINRNQQLLAQGIAFVQRGGYVDFTTSTTAQELAAGEVKCSKALRQMLDAGVSVENISFSSDANASLPVFDSHGNFEGLGIGRIASLFEEVRDAVVQEKIPLTIALQVASKTPAKILNLARKGHLSVGADADIVLLDADSLAIRAVIARGACLWQDGSFESLSVRRFNPFF